MKMVVYWTENSRLTYKHSVENILKKWSVETAIKLENEVNNLILKLENNSKPCPPTIKNQILEGV